jgi:hypothetical protein
LSRNGEEISLGIYLGENPERRVEQPIAEWGAQRAGKQKNSIEAVLPVQGAEPGGIREDHGALGR